MIYLTRVEHFNAAHKLYNPDWTEEQTFSVTGALADLNLQLDGKGLANTLGLIRWLRPGEGAGIEFFYATEEERDALRDYLLDWVKEQKKRRGSRDG